MEREEENKKLSLKITLLEEELKNMQARMHNLQSIMLSNVSHDIRTPMNAIVGFANLLTDERLDRKELNGFINQINSNSSDLLQIIDNMIDASLLQCGDLELFEKECSLNDLVDNLYKYYKGVPALRHKRLNLVVSKGEDDDCLLLADHKRLKQVLNNLIGNAIKFTDNGYIEFGYHRGRNNKVVFYVKDSGIGLSNFAEEDLFKPFWSRLYKENGNINRGAGLGLAVSKSLIELMGGKIWLKSIPGEGTCFYFNLHEKRVSFIKKRLHQIGTVTKRNIASIL